MWLWLLALLPLAFASRGCGFQPILKGVSIKQSFGESQKHLYRSEADCKKRCSEETKFNCTAFLWGGDRTSDCYLYDRMDLARQIFVDQRLYLLYVEVCDGEPVPAIGYCQFLLNRTSVAAPTSGQRVSPGLTTEASCREFCIANYWGQSCDAFIVSTERASECSLYPLAPSNVEAGSQNLWTKNCFPPPVNCEYSMWSQWTECTKTCGGGTRERRREILREGSANGVQCMESEKTQTGSCAIEDCGAKCIYSEWTDFGPCNATCSTTTGIRSRSRTIVGQTHGCKKEEVDQKSCAATTECGNTCIFSSWTQWSPCSAACTSTRSRSLEMGDETTCEVEYGPLENTIVCDGGLCGSIGETLTTPKLLTPSNDEPSSETTTLKTTTTTKNTANVPETGCRISGVDPSSRPSSAGYKAVGVRENCASMCQQEKNFKCGGYSTTGPGGVCVLHGTIDRPISIQPNSRFYLQDLECKSNGTSGTGVCSWKKIESDSTDSSFSAPGNFVSIGLTIDAPHCGTLCMMNFPLFRPHPCQAYAWNPSIPFESSRDNCFMYHWSAVSNSSQSVSQFELFRLVCDSQ